jgi:hypothetical protein
MISPREWHHVQASHLEPESGQSAIGALAGVLLLRLTGSAKWPTEIC